MANRQIQSKTRTPKSLVYNTWDVIYTAGGEFNLGLNYKFTHITYNTENFSAPGLANSINVVRLLDGPSMVTPSPTVRTSYGWIDLGGTFAVGDKVITTVAGISTTTVVTSRTPDLTLLAAAIVRDLNYNTAFNTLFIANSLGGEYVIQPLVYSTATPAYSVSVVSAAGTATAGGATMVAGTGGPNPYTVPVSDQTGSGVVPSATAVAGNSLFPVDIIIPTFAAAQANRAGSVYAYTNFDVIWPANSQDFLVTGVVGSSGSAMANQVNLYGVIVDNHPMSPEDSNGLFQLSPFLL